MPSIQGPFISIALCRVRRGVTFCCAILALALLTQLLVWCFATFTAVRYHVLEEKVESQAIVSAAETDESKPAAFASDLPNDNTAINPNRVPTKYDKMMAGASSLSVSAGVLASIFLMPLLVLGVLLGAGSATPGVEKTVSAFTWAMVLLVLVLPLGAKIGLPWSEGALSSYAFMTGVVDSSLDENGNGGGTTFYARFALLPLACLVGVGLVGLRFSSGVEAGITPRENMRLDPTLEKEAANITPSSLHGGRAAGALRTVSPSPAPVAAVNGSNGSAAPHSPNAKPSAPLLQTAAGEMPKRLI